jgi:hypothetical protein
VQRVVADGRATIEAWIREDIERVVANGIQLAAGANKTVGAVNAGGWHNACGRDYAGGDLWQLTKSG